MIKVLVFCFAAGYTAQKANTLYKSIGEFPIRCLSASERLQFRPFRGLLKTEMNHLAKWKVQSRFSCQKYTKVIWFSTTYPTPPSNSALTPSSTQPINRFMEF